MNRSIALFVALAVLVAHSFAIHSGGGGSLAPPYDEAYVAFRLGRNVVYEGALVWNAGVPASDGYPSLLWIGVCALGERLYLQINPYCQAIGTAAATMTLVVASRFHPNRIASMIAPALLALSGGLAAAAVAGTETALLTLLVTAAFLGYERRWKVRLGLCLLLAGLTRPEGWLLALAMLGLRLGERLRARRGEPAAELARSSLAPLLAPAAGLALVWAWRWSRTGLGLSSYGRELLDVQPGELERGIAYFRDFLVTSASPLLLAYALWYLFRRRFSATGSRALLLFAVWVGIVIANGGGEPVFCAGLVPALPLALIAAQEGMITALNSSRRWVRGLAGTSFVLAVSAAALASRIPADFGPIPLRGWHEALTEPHYAPRYGYEGQLGRAGLQEEIARTAVLRATGIYLRDELDPNRSVLTPWPGSIGYLSRLVVHDLLERVEPSGSLARPTPWVGPARVDLVASLSRRADYVVPFNTLPPRPPTAHELVTNWLSNLDRHPADPDRREAILRILVEYELVAVPLEIERGLGSSQPRDTSYLLRRRDLALAPQLDFLLDEEDELSVHLRHAGHTQTADLQVRATDVQGRTWYLEPTGGFVPERPVLARSYLLVYPTGERSIELVRTSLPLAGPRFVEVTASLRNPAAIGDEPFALACEEARIELR